MGTTQSKTKGENGMKARQYFENYRQEMTCGDEKRVQAAINQFVLELNDEAKDMLKAIRIGRRCLSCGS